MPEPSPALRLLLRDFRPEVRVDEEEDRGDGGTKSGAEAGRASFDARRVVRSVIAWSWFVKEKKKKERKREKKTGVKKVR